MSQSKNFLWYKRFKDGRTSVDDDERSGRPSTSTTPQNIAKVREAILIDRRQTIYDIYEIEGLSYGTVQRSVAGNLNMRRISARLGPRLPSEDQKAHRVSVCRELKQQARDHPNFISNIINGDETWVYGYDPETKQQSTQWNSSNSPRPKRARQVRNNVKSMLIFFRHARHCQQGIRTPWSNHQWQVLLWGFEAAEVGHSAQTSRQVEEKQLVSPPLQRTRSHITRCSTIPDFQKHYSDSQLPLFAWPRPMRLFPIPQDEITAERASFWHDWGDPRRIARDYRQTHIWELPGMHEIMGNTLVSLYTCPRGLLRRRRWKLGVTVRNFFYGQIPKFLGSTSCVCVYIFVCV